MYNTAYRIVVWLIARLIRLGAWLKDPSTANCQHTRQRVIDNAKGKLPVSRDDWEYLFGASVEIS